MKKKILALAIGAALTVPAFVAQADVTVYGLVQAEIAQVKADDNGYASIGSTYYALPGTGNTSSAYASTATGNTTAAYGDGTSGVNINNARRVAMVDNKNGRVGVKFNEDLGNGMTGLGVVEWVISTTDQENANGGFTGQRETWVGIQDSSLGQIALGRFNGLYKVTGGVMWDPFIATTLEARNNGGMSGGNFGQDGYLSNMIRYIAPKFAGVTLSGMYSPDAGSASKNSISAGNGAGISQGAKGDYELAADWKGGPNNMVEVIGVYARHANSTNTVGTGVAGTTYVNYDQERRAKLGAQVTFGSGITHTFSAQYETITNRDNISGFGNPTLVLNTNLSSQVTGTYSNLNEKVLFGGYQLGIGNTIVAAQLGQDKVDAVNMKTTYVAVGAIYKFSKTFRAFGGVRRTQTKFDLVGDQPKVQTISVGLRKDF